LVALRQPALSIGRTIGSSAFLATVDEHFS
jgi:hypothetical protein